jgi:hypothetical protein
MVILARETGFVKSGIFRRPERERISAAYKKTGGAASGEHPLKKYLLGDIPVNDEVT